MGYLREVIRREFPEYTLRENVAVTELVGNVADSMQLYSTRPYQAYRAGMGRVPRLPPHKEAFQVA